MPRCEMCLFSRKGLEEQKIQYREVHAKLTEWGRRNEQIFAYVAYYLMLKKSYVCLIT